MKNRSFLDLTIEELEEILKTNILPPGVTFERMEDRKDFNTLVSHRNTPHLVAKALLREKGALSLKVKEPKVKNPNIYIGVEPLSFKEKRLSLKEQESQRKREKNVALQRMEANLLKELTEIKKILEDLLTRKV